MSHRLRQPFGSCEGLKLFVILVFEASYGASYDWNFFKTLEDQAV